MFHLKLTALYINTLFSQPSSGSSEGKSVPFHEGCHWFLSKQEVSIDPLQQLQEFPVMKVCMTLEAPYHYDPAPVCSHDRLENSKTE
jgi:hypothetical protein